MGTWGGAAMKPQPGNSAKLTYWPWMAAKNHQLLGSSRARACIDSTPLAYQNRSRFAKVPPFIQAFLRVKVAMAGRQWLFEPFYNLQRMIPNSPYINIHSPTGDAGSAPMCLCAPPSAKSDACSTPAVRPGLQHYVCLNLPQDFCRHQEVTAYMVHKSIFNEGPILRTLPLSGRQGA